MNNQPKARKQIHKADVAFGLVLVHWWLITLLALNFNEVLSKEYDEGSVSKCVRVCVYICLEHNAILNEIENVFIRFFLFFNNHAIL